MEPYSVLNEVIRRACDGQPDPTLVSVIKPSAREKLAQESRWLIDEKISNFDESIRRLKSQRNELAPISRLPPEVMSIIFSYVAGGFQSDPMPLYRYFFTHVSQTWRSVALNSPTLWRVLPSSIPWANAMLERSKAAGLFVQLRLSNWAATSPRVLFWKDVFCNHASRIRELDLTEISSSLLSVFFGDLQPSSLVLHSLQLHQSTRYHDDPPLFPTAVIQTEHLRSLSVTGYDGAWFSLPFSCLTNLKIHNIPNRPCLDVFIKILRGNPQLQIIDMEDSLPLASESLGSIASVDLPSLGSLRLSSTRSPKEISNILSCITAPSTAVLEISCRNGYVAQDYRDTLINLASSFSIFFSAMSKSAAVLYDDAYLQETGQTGNCLQLSAWEIGNLDVRPRKRKLHLTINLRTWQGPRTMLQEIFPSLPLLNIQNLTLDMDCAYPLVKETLCNLFCLQNVTLVGYCTVDFITALRHKSPGHDDDAAFLSVSFPTLRTLSITGISFRSDGRCPIEDFQDCFMERYERGAELMKLKLQGCYDLDSVDVELLKEIIVDVEWDGLILEEADSEEDNDGVGLDAFDDAFDDYDYWDYDSDCYYFPI